MSRKTGKSESIPRDAASSLREQALQLVQSSLEDIRAQHPLDISQVFNNDRPSMGGQVPLQLYRAVRLLAFRETLGSRISGAVLRVSGRNVAGKLGIRGVDDLIAAFHEYSIGRTVVELQAGGRLVLTARECATCSGIPAVGEALCHFEAGMIAGSMEGILGEMVSVRETRCWGLGDAMCTWDARGVSAGEDAESVDTLDLLMEIAGRTAAAVDGTLAVRRKNLELRGSYQKLRESERLKKDIMDMIVHDMRTPLTSVIGGIQTLSDMMDARLRGRERELLNMALSGGQSLLNMINDLLDISKLEEHKLSLKKHPSSLSDVVESAIHQVDVLARRKKLTLETAVTEDLPQAPMDRDRVVRVLVNLLANAIHHTSAGGRITVAAGCDPGGEKLRVEVRDTGEGIPAECQNRIFDKFVQLESHRSSRRSSSGLGLTFCKLTTEAHGGNIWVESEPGRGSTFIFTLPMGSSQT